MTSLRMAWSELVRLTRSRLAVLALIAIVTIPTIYAGLYLYANHDPYSALDRIPVALVMNDRGATSPQTGERVNIGRQVADDLIERDAFDFHQVSQAEAVRGVRGGEYDFALTVPRDFSAALMSTARYRPRQGMLRLTTNDANSYLATTIADRLVDEIKTTLQTKVGKRAAMEFLLGFKQLHDGLSRATGGADRLATGANQLHEGADRLTNGAARLVDGSAQLSTGATRLHDGATTLSDGTDRLARGARTLSDGADTLADGASRLADGAGRLSDGADQLSTGADALHDGAQKMTRGLARLSKGADRLADGATRLSDGADQLATGANQLATGLDTLQENVQPLPQQTQQLADGAQQVADGTQQISNVADQFAQVSQQAVDRFGAVRDRLEKRMRQAGLTDEQIARVLESYDSLHDPLVQANEQVQQVDTQLGQLADGAQQVADGTQQLADGIPALVSGIDQADQGAHDLASGAARLARAADRLATGAQQLSTGADAAHTGAVRLTRGAGRLADGADRLASAATRLQNGADQLSVGATRLGNGADRLATGATRLGHGADRLATGAERLASGADQLHDGAVRLRQGAGDLADGATRLHDGAVRLRNSLHDAVGDIPNLDKSTRDDVASTIGNPVSIDRSPQTEAGTYGAGLAPFFMALAAWIGGYVLFLLVRPLSRRAIAASQTPLRIAVGGWLPPAIFGVAQVVLMLAVVWLGLGIELAHPVWTFLFLGLVSITFIAIVHMLNAWLGTVGQFIGLVLMVVQLVSAGGTFPWQTIPIPLQIPHHVLPMSYAIDGLRHLMYGGDLAVMALDCGVLVAYLVASLLLAAMAARRQRVWTPGRVKPALVM